MEPGRKEPTHFAAMVGISSLEKDKQGRQSVEILPWSPRRGRGWSQHLGQSSWWFPACLGWGGELCGAVLCCSPGSTNMVRQVRQFSILKNFSLQKLQQN